MIFGFGDKGYTNLLTRALKDVNEKCETIPDPCNWNTTSQITLVFLDRNYDQFISKLSAAFPKEKIGIRKFYDTCASVLSVWFNASLSIEDLSYL